MPSSHLILCRPLFLLPPILPNIRIFSNGSTLRMRWPKYWSFSFSIIHSKEHPGLISFRMDWLDLLAVQGTLKSLLQHHSSKASILRRSAFFNLNFFKWLVTLAQEMPPLAYIKFHKCSSIFTWTLQCSIVFSIPVPYHIALIKVYEKCFNF